MHTFVPTDFVVMHFMVQIVNGIRIFLRKSRSASHQVGITYVALVASMVNVSLSIIKHLHADGAPVAFNVFPNRMFQTMRAVLMCTACLRGVKIGLANSTRHVIFTKCGKFVFIGPVTRNVCVWGFAVFVNLRPELTPVLRKHSDNRPNGGLNKTRKIGMDR